MYLLLLLTCKDGPAGDIQTTSDVLFWWHVVVVVVVVVVVEEMNIIKVALSHFCCRTTVQSDSVSVARQVCFFGCLFLFVGNITGK